MRSSIFRKKDIKKIKDVSAHDNLEKVLGWLDLIAIGIGTVMGTGIFVLTGIQAAQFSGPAVMISLALAAFAAIFIALAYTEMATAIPSSGGSYAYVYVALGEVVAFIVGFLYLFYCLCAIPAIAAGWGGYFVGLLKQMGIYLPHEFTHNPFEGGILNVPPVVICLLMTGILIKGVKESTTLNIILVFIKLCIAFLFIGIAFPHFEFSNWSNFMPFGFKGVTISAGVLFFAYNGFEAVANAAEECKNPTRDMTIGLIGSLVICGIIYVIIAAMLTGIVHYSELNTPEALSYALRAVGSNLGGAIVAAGGVIGITTVVLFQTYSMSRILMAMSRDRLLPSVFSKIHKKYHTPHIATIFCGVITATTAGLFPIDILASLTSMAVLTVMIIVVIAAMYFRKAHPHVKRPFKCPAIYIVGTIAVFCCAYLLTGIGQHVGIIFISVAIFSVFLYFFYSKRRVDRHLSKQGVHD
ncbi:MAG: amino acid permease [Rickettsiales bacterium]|nr:amino acid permease [Rickettsiales bacterium]